MGAMSSPFLTLCVIYLLGPVVNFGRVVQTTPVGNRLQEMATAVQPSFSKGLVDLSNLFDLVMDHDGKIDYFTDDNGTMLSIQEVIQSALNSLNETENISNYHMDMYEASLLSLSSDISAKDTQLRNYINELEFLTIEKTKWKAEAGKLKKETTELNNKVREAEHRAEGSQRSIDWRVQSRWLWITMTVLTGGLALPGLIINERERQNIERERDAWRSQANEKLQLVQIAQNNLRDIENRQQAIKKSIEQTQTSLLSAQTMLEQLRTQYAILGGLGIQIRNISTFLTVLNGEIAVVHGQHPLVVLFSPLLESVDSFVKFLEDNANILVFIGDREALTKIRRHVSQNVVPELVTEVTNELHDKDNIDT